jgi:hypothetical protein
MLETATTMISAAVFDPVATVTVVDVVFGTVALRTKTLTMFALEPKSAVPMSVYVPPVLPSLHVGEAFVLPLAAQKTTSRSPTAGVITAVRLLVPDEPPPAALVL